MALLREILKNEKNLFGIFSFSDEALHTCKMMLKQSFVQSSVYSLRRVQCGQNGQNFGHFGEIFSQTFEDKIEVPLGSTILKSLFINCQIYKK
jgi:hypothetical protein